jgi:nucleoside-diphosphate-sugar epimerase
MRASGVPVTIVRPFSGYGTDQSTGLPVPGHRGESDKASGPHRDWSDSSRDFVHVDDLLAASLALVEAVVAGPTNTATGVATSMSALAMMAAEAVGYEPTIEVLGCGVSLDWSKWGATARLDGVYKCQVSLAEGVRRAVAALSPSAGADGTCRP